MPKEHDFKRFPELTNSQMTEFYFQSPHKQIVDDFTAEVVEVIDGDTVKLRWSERDFDFRLRMAELAAAELNEKGGEEAKKWLEDQIFGKTVDILIDQRNRVGKYGRLIGTIMADGTNIGELAKSLGYAVDFGTATSDIARFELPHIDKMIPRLRI